MMHVLKDGFCYDVTERRTATVRASLQGRTSFACKCALTHHQKWLCYE